MFFQEKDLNFFSFRIISEKLDLLLSCQGCKRKPFYCIKFLPRSDHDRKISWPGEQKSGGKHVIECVARTKIRQPCKIVSTVIFFIFKISKIKNSKNKC